VNFGEAKTRVQDAIGASSTELASQIGTFVSDIIRDIHASGRWPWDRRSEMFTARGAITGTATWTKGATTVTLNTGNVATQALADEYVSGLIKLSTNIYEIDGWVQSTGVLTVSPAILDASGTTASVTIIQDMVSMPTDVETVIEVVDMAYPRVLGARAGNLRKRLWPDPFLVIGAYPYEWWTRGVNSAGDIELILYPPPNEDRMYQVEYWRRVQLPTVDGDELEVVTGIPERFHPVIVAGGKYRAFEFEFENEGVKAAAQAEFLTGLSRLRNFSRPDAGAIRQLRSGRSNHRSSGRYLPTDRITGYTDSST